MVKDHCSVPYRFQCISDHPIDGVDTLQASRGAQGWWVKLDFFKPGVTGSGPCIGLDLDITLVGDIASLQSRTLSGAQDARTKDKYLNSSVLAWTPHKETDSLYMTNPPVKRTGPYPKGDQEYIADKYPNYKILAGCYSYRDHLDNGKLELPENTIVVFFHGSPTPADDEVCKHPWNAKSWGSHPRRDRLLRPKTVMTANGNL